MMANRLASNVYWSQWSNFIDIPTDCPQRDERLGWGDGAQTFVRAAAMRAVDVFRTLFFAHSTDLVARSAQVLGREADAAHYRQLHQAIKAAFRRAYVQADGSITGDTQACYALALVFGMLDDGGMVTAADHLVANVRRHDWTPTTGLEGTLPLLCALSMIGRTDIAYRLLHNDRFPSWNFSTKNGATTIWERWNSWTPEEGFGDAWMNSFNHVSLGAV